LGDDVNLASRLDGQSKTYGIDNVISEATRKAAPGFATLEIDLLRVKGRSQPVRVFTLVGTAATVDEPAFVALAAVHGRMLAAYRASDWDGADAALAACQGAHWPGLDGLYALYGKRLAACRADPPGADWDGVYTAEDK
jgi:adenylate cyclase